MNSKNQYIYNIQTCCTTHKGIKTTSASLCGVRGWVVRCWTRELGVWGSIPDTPVMYNILGQGLNPHCLWPPSSDGPLVHIFKVGITSFLLVAQRPCQGEGWRSADYCILDRWTINMCPPSFLTIYRIMRGCCNCLNHTTGLCLCVIGPAFGHSSCQLGYQSHTILSVHKSQYILSAARQKDLTAAAYNNVW
jgi:hypothetical protein